MVDIYKQALEHHKKWQGKISTHVKSIVQNKEDLSIAYTPGVAAPCKEIVKNPGNLYDYTIKGNTIAIVSDGSAVLGLGNIGPQAALPVMEGKAVLFKEFAGVDAFPICLAEQDPDQIIETVQRMSVVFGGINLEDIKAPECFYIEKRLKEELDIPVFHDDQHGTAVITMAGLINALKIVDKNMRDIKVVVNGAGAAGFSISNMLLLEAVQDIVVLDSKGAIYEDRENLNQSKKKLSYLTNKGNKKGKLKDLIKGTDVFIGVSVADIMTKEMVKSMANDPVIFAMANPEPEIIPEKAFAGGARVV